ncbi:MAG: DUF3536 domain-containing protein, partial [Acidobacteria bacterium]|nr:DUF3536 domain-containing protein [Acidobacteriota bacterium]
VFEEYGNPTKIYCYDVERNQHQVRECSGAKLVVGQAVFTSNVTQEQLALDFGVLHLGGHSVAAGVQRAGPTGRRACHELVDALPRLNQPELREQIQQCFGNVYGLESLFKDPQRKILTTLSNAVMAEVDAAHRQVYEHHSDFIHLLIRSEMPLPTSLRASAESALNSRLREALAESELRSDDVHRLLEESTALGITLDAATLEYVLRKRLERMAEIVTASMAGCDAIRKLQEAVALARAMPFPVDLWWVQTLCYGWIDQACSNLLAQQDRGEPAAKAALEQICALSEQLLFAPVAGAGRALVSDASVSS